MCTEVQPADDISAEEIDRIVSTAILTLIYFSDVRPVCPCGSGIELVDTDSCSECEYSEITFDEVEIELCEPIGK